MSLKVSDIPHNYEQALKITLEKNYTNIKVGSNGSLQYNSDETISLWLWNTEIVRFYKDGRLKIDDGGYKTRTTRSWINWILDYGLEVVKKNNKNVLIVELYEGDKLEFQLPITLKYVWRRLN